MVRPTHVALAATVIAVAASLSPAQTYTFDSGDQGWRVYDIDYLGDHTPNRPVSATPAPSDANTGFPAPALRISDLAGETWIGAPVAALGARAGLYGQALSFDVLYRTADNEVYASAGIEGPDLSLWIAADPPALNTWLHRSYAFLPGAWKVNSINGPVATETQIRAVLSNLSGVFIHTEWNTGPDDTSVDNVVIGVAPPIGCGPADIGRAGGLPGSDGLLDNNDFIAFITFFFDQDALADRGSAGGFPGVDGQFDNNDFIVFINQFFAGC